MPDEQIHEPDAVLDGNTGVSRAARAEPDRVQRAAEDRSMQQNAVRQQHREENRQLRRNDAPQIALSERKERRRKTAVVDRRFGDALGNAAKQRERAERDDQRAAGRAARSATRSVRRPAQPTASATAAAAGIGRCRSCHAAPKQTAASPIMAPTDKSMPPVIRIGVSAMASSPSSALSRAISKKLASVKKFGAMSAKIADFGRQARRQARPYARALAERTA